MILGYETGTTTSLGTTTATTYEQYDLDGNVTQTTDADGRVDTFAYDWSGRQTGETWYASTTAQTDADSDGSLSYSFDVEGNILEALQHGGSPRRQASSADFSPQASVSVLDRSMDCGLKSTLRQSPTTAVDACAPLFPDPQSPLPSTPARAHAAKTTP